MSARRLLLVLALLLAPLSGCADASETAAPPRTVTVTVTEPAPSPPAPLAAADDDNVPASTQPPVATFEGDYFSLSYPAAWEVETAEVSKGSYLDTTIRSAGDPDVMVRVDVSPVSHSAPAAVAAEVEGYLRPQPRYRRLRYGSTSFLGYEAVRWDFLVEEDGILLRKSDIFFTTDAGDGVAVLIQAPAARYRALAETLEATRDSLVIASESYEDYAGEEESYEEPTPDADFCATHECIDNFEEGRGSVVQCADGTWSQSGGIQGACSHHGGVADGGSPATGGDYDPNDDGSTVNWCGASRDGDGDGLWCEGR